MSGHTPGAWRAEHRDDGGEGWHEIIAPLAGPASGMGVVASTIDRDLYICDPEEDAANARLMAAAPDLLDAAKEALHVLTPATPRMDGLDRQRQWLRAAIAKAEGRVHEVSPTEVCFCGGRLFLAGNKCRGCRCGLFPEACCNGSRG